MSFTVQEITGLYHTKVVPKISAKNKTKIQNGLHRISKTYHSYIPVDEIECVLNSAGYHLIQEDGEPWSGIFCGRNSDCHLQFADAEGNVPKHLIALQWYLQEKVSSRSYEINCYMS
jgi:hypothetical protein